MLVISIYMYIKKEQYIHNRFTLYTFISKDPKILYYERPRKICEPAILKI